MRAGLWMLPALIASVVGLLWNSRHLRSRKTGESDPFLEAGAPPSDLPRRTEFWERGDSSCLHLDGVCGRDGGWFYAPRGRRPGEARQPTIRLDVSKGDIERSHGYDIEIEEGIFFNVSSASHRRYDEASCSFSPTPYHVVIQSAYSEMMGEFYSRAILPLDQWMRRFPFRSNGDVQMYIHFIDRRKQRLLEGHRLLLGGLPNNDKFDNFYSLMPGDRCRCYRKLVFCGYTVGNATAGSSLDDSAGMDPAGDVAVFKPRGSIENPKTYCASIPDALSLKRGNCAVYRQLRRDLISTYSEKNPTLHLKIEQYRRDVLFRGGLIGNETENVGDWKFVGLADRKYRRTWLNIEDAIAMCNKTFARHKIVCVTVDVEEADTPEQQLLMHRSLHAFIGVHGAQLTQGVLLPRHGHILELLPWVPFYLWGGWVATTHRPTPLGIIFHKTDLNHVGYPLDRESVPLCLHVDRSDKELERRCLMNETNGVIKKFRWADRDFNVSVEVIQDFISIFLLQESSSICDDMKRRAEQKKFVLYNAFCQQGVNQSYRAKHYYRERDESQPKNIHDNH